MKLYLLFEDPLLLLQRDAVIVLDRDHNGVNSLRDHSSVLLVVMYRHLWDRQEVKGHNDVFIILYHWPDRLFSLFYSYLSNFKSCCFSDPNFHTGWLKFPCICLPVQTLTWNSLWMKLWPENIPKKVAVFAKASYFIKSLILLVKMCAQSNLWYL